MVWDILIDKKEKERKKLLEAFLGEIGENFALLEKNQQLKDRVWRIANASQQLSLLDPECANIIGKVYEKVSAMNDALTKYASFITSNPYSSGFKEQKREFDQFLAWYKGELGAIMDESRQRIMRNLQGVEVR
ncbi:MAG: hypothetical protein AB1779_05060 [Candidatus Thermoplasmatota archaeon]